MALQEILKLKNKDVKGKSSISVSIGAREIMTTYEFSDEDQKIIDELVKGKDPDGYLILGHTNSTAPLSREQAYRVFKAVGQSVGISAIGAQTMRKTYAWRYYKSTGDITYLQHMFNHASPAITYRYIGEKPNIQVVLRKNTAEENERSRYLLYLNDTGRKRRGIYRTELFESRKKQKVEDNELLEKYLKISKQEKEEILKKPEALLNEVCKATGCHTNGAELAAALSCLHCIMSCPVNQERT